MRSARLFLLLGIVVVMGCSAEQEETSRTDQTNNRLVPPAAAEPLNRAMFALNHQAYMTALAWVDRAEQAVPGLAETDFVRGRINFELGRMPEARAAYQKVLSQDDSYEGAWLNLGNVAFFQKQYAEALEAYRQEQHLRPTPASWHAMGGAYEALGRTDSARWAYQKAVSIDSTYAPAFSSLASWYESEGAFEEALRYARRALALEPENLTYQYAVGAMHFRTGNYEDAVDRLQPIVQTQPWNYTALFTLGQALQRMGLAEEGNSYLDKAEAVRVEQSQVELLQRTVRERPDDVALHLEVGDALRRTGRLREALVAYHRAQSLRPDNLSLQNNIATIYLQQGDTTEALTRYHRILQQDFTFAETWLNLGLHYARTGRQSAARAAWEKALRYEPENPAVKDFFARMNR